MMRMLGTWWMGTTMKELAHTSQTGPGPQYWENLVDLVWSSQTIYWYTLYHLTPPRICSECIISKACKSKDQSQPRNCFFWPRQNFFFQYWHVSDYLKQTNDFVREKELTEIVMWRFWVWCRQTMQRRISCITPQSNWLKPTWNCWKRQIRRCWIPPSAWVPSSTQNWVTWRMR